MTRVTNFGRKRTYVEAGFPAEVASAAAVSGDDVPPEPRAEGVSASEEGAVEPPKKKRKRAGKKRKEVPTAAGPEGTDRAEGGGDNIAEGNPESSGSTSTEKIASKGKGKGKVNKKRLKEKAERALQSETRRQKRISERQAGTICFACRQKGHAAKDCPVALSTNNDGSEKTDNAPNGVGICYRCGSRKHSLSRCKKPTDPSNPLPFASCFVCSGKGHLASSCPQNKSKGIYPNGGSCKLCGDTTHLARNCGLRQDDGANNTAILLGTGQEAGADEDDFHTFKRRRVEIDQDERQEEKAKRALDVKAGVHSGVVKSFGRPAPPASKKVVYF
ncbi:hypothetical protein PLICRDRAFT_103776 [Plicaturopsis crispa FD-325 SS-3]|nr:hypothetical protein PLICRDRAFT_103776 [Plicaturopsis crispa FD-325 SS-3]